jgi:predicted metal-dependent peptidase
MSEQTELATNEVEHKNGSHLIAKNKDNHPKIIDSIVFLLTDMRMYAYRFYGEFGQYINYKEDNSCPTAGVTYHGGKLYMVWNRKFLDGLTQKQALFLYLHEISHLLGNCHKRVEYNGLNHQYANIAHDMVINSNLLEDPSLKDFVQMIEGGYVSPKKYDGQRILEPIYSFLQEHDEKVEQKRKENEKNQQQKPQNGDNKKDEEQEKGQKQKGKGEDQDDDQNDDQGGDQPSDKDSDQQGDGQGQGQPDPNAQGEGNGNGQPDPKNPLTGDQEIPRDENGAVNDMPDDKKYKEYGENGQTIDVHFDPKNKLEKELLERISKDITEKLKNRGLVNANIQKMIDSLERKPNNWLSQLKRWIVGAKGIGNYTKTFKKANKYNLEGFRGKRKNAIVFDVILDTSGSMTDDIPKVLGTILRDGIVCNVIQIDTKVQSDTLISSPKDLKLIVLKGFGGTVLQPAIDYIVAKKQQKRPCVIMTDGYTDELDIRGIGDKVIILTTGVQPPIVGTNFRLIDCSEY